MIQKYLGVRCAPVYCTCNPASRLVRTNTDKHGLKDLCKELLRHRNLQAAAVLRLGRGETDPGADRSRRLRRPLFCTAYKAEMERLARLREGRTALADACFRFLPDRAAPDLAGWADEDIFRPLTVSVRLVRRGPSCYIKASPRR